MTQKPGEKNYSPNSSTQKIEKEVKKPAQAQTQQGKPQAQPAQPAQQKPFSTPR